MCSHSWIGRPSKVNPRLPGAEFSNTQKQKRRAELLEDRKEDIRLPGKENSDTLGAGCPAESSMIGDEVDPDQLAVNKQLSLDRQ